MALGVVCHWLKTRTKSTGRVETYNGMEDRVLQLGRWQAGKYTDDQIRGVFMNNVRNLANMALTIGASVKCYRVSSALLPLADKVDTSLWDNTEVRDELARAGRNFRSLGVRLTMHPGQFCVLSSDTDRVIKNGMRDLEIHAWVMDALGMPLTTQSPINIHGGKSKAEQRLIQSIGDLPDNVRKRLTLENDESAYSVKELLVVSQQTGVPIVLDSHHHTFRTGDMSLEEAFREATATWSPDILPLQHVSNTDPALENGSFADRRKHADYIHKIPDVQLEALIANKIDLECEAKMKNFAVDRIRQQYGL